MKKKHNKKKIILTTILLLLLIVLILLMWSRFISTSGLIVKEYPIKTKLLSENYDGFKIVHFSDLHYGSTVGEKELKNLVNKINNLKPDIIVFTGDLVEQGVILSKDEIKNITKTLNKLNPSIEILAVKGNHDYDHTYFEDIVPNLEWTILDNTYKYVYNGNTEKIVFVGLDSYLRGEPDYSNAFSFLNEQENKIYTIVLGHEPDMIDEISDYDFDLMLAGHSHLGQVRIPFIGSILTPNGAKKYFDEHYIVDNTELYINGGIGTSILKFRFFAKPSINLYRFYTQ